MSKRQTLRKLQQRIADMLQQASSQTGLSASWLGVRLGAHRLLLPLQQAGEIYSVGQIEPLPYAKDWFLGVAALRGSVYGVVDLSVFLQPKAEAHAGKQIADKRQKPRLLAINEALGVNAVIRIDALEGLRSRDDFVRSETPTSGVPLYYGSVFFDQAGDDWQEINLQALVQMPEFLNISAVETDMLAIAAAE